MPFDAEYHTTVLLHEGVEALSPKADGVYVDATLGAAGHTKLLLDKLGVQGKVLGFDQDEDAVKNAPSDERFVLCQGNFRFLKQFLAANGVDQVDGVLADLGVSGHHFDVPERGFSFRFEAPLDMRMNQAQAKSALSVLNEYEHPDLLRVIRLFGESSFAKPITNAIIRNRPLATTTDLVKAVNAAVPERKAKGELPKVFQAIRIEVNQELEVLRVFLEQAEQLLKPGGRLVVISYHSLEDRLVKHFMRSGNFEDKQEKDVYGNVRRALDPFGKVITPSEEEIERNPRARSAKMRIAVKR